MFRFVGSVRTHWSEENHWKIRGIFQLQRGQTSRRRLRLRLNPRRFIRSFEIPIAIFPPPPIRGVFRDHHFANGKQRATKEDGIFLASIKLLIVLAASIRYSSNRERLEYPFVVSLNESVKITRARIIVRWSTTTVSYDSFTAVVQPSYVLDQVQQAIPELPYTQVQPVQVHLTIRTRTT